MITLGLDPHPGTHTVVALDLNGSLLESLTVLNTTAGLAQLQLFASSSHCVDGWSKEQEITSSLRLSKNYSNVEKQSIRYAQTSRVNTVREEGGRRTMLSMQPIWLVPCWRLRSCRFFGTRIRNVSCRSCLERNGDYRNSSNRGALKELADDSPVREILEQVIRTLVVQLKELQRKLCSVVSRVMPGLLDLPGIGAIMAGTLLAEAGDPQRFPSADHLPAIAVWLRSREEAGKTHACRSIPAVIVV